MLFARVFVPRVGGTISAREDKIGGDIGEARLSLRDEAEAQAKDAADELAQARGRAQRLALDAKAAVASEAAARQAEEEARLGEVLAVAEARISAARTEAMTQVCGIAAEAQALSSRKLVGAAASSAEVERRWPARRRHRDAISAGSHIWEGLGLAVFLGAPIWLKVSAWCLTALDDRAARIQAQLDEATHLRQEAERLLAEIKVQREATEKQAAETIAAAKDEAERMAVESKAKLEEQIKRRGELAERRIAVAELPPGRRRSESRRRRSGRRVAEAVLAARLAGATSDPLVDSAVAQLAGKFQ